MTLARKDTIGVLKAAEANQVSMLFDNLMTMDELSRFWFPKDTLIFVGSVLYFVRGGTPPISGV